ncbi:unnamed protein product [Calypogeia fissa]
MSRAKSILTRRAKAESNALRQGCVFGASPHEQATAGNRWLERRIISSLSGSEPCSPSQPIRKFSNAPQFERIWWDKGSDSRQGVSIWRPKTSSGYPILGDCLVEGLEPPRSDVSIQRYDTGILVKPIKYLLRVYISGKGLEDLYIWFPVAPTGYMAVGCVATTANQMPPVDRMCCVRSDYVTRAKFPMIPIWSMNMAKRNASLWKVETEAHTFIAQPNLERPPDCLANYLWIGDHNSRDQSTSDELDIWAADKLDSSLAEKRYSPTAGKGHSSTFNKGQSSRSEGHNFRDNSTSDKLRSSLAKKCYNSTAGKGLSSTLNERQGLISESHVSRDHSTSDNFEKWAADKLDSSFAEKCYSSTTGKGRSSTFNERQSSRSEWQTVGTVLGLGVGAIVLYKFYPLAKLASKLAIRCFLRR